jgi:ADP-ribose pyrophosphatase
MLRETRSEGADVAKKKPLAKVLSTKTVFRSPVFNVEEVEVIEPHGVRAKRAIVTHPGSVVVLPVFADGKLLLIRQYRHSAKQYLWEVVAGRKDHGETFEHGAHRELKEETGYTAKKMRQLMDVFPTPGFVEENMVIFLAEGLTKGIATPEADEKITQKIVTLKETEQWIKSGKIRDAKTVAAVLYYSRFLAKKK